MIATVFSRACPFLMCETHMPLLWGVLADASCVYEVKARSEKEVNSAVAITIQVCWAR